MSEILIVENPTISVRASSSSFSLVLDPVYLGEYGIPETLGWPPASLRPTTARSARALEAASVEDTTPRFDEIEIDDGFGI